MEGALQNRTYSTKDVDCGLTPGFRARCQIVRYRLVTFAFAVLLPSLSPVATHACGWWGDGEMDSDDSDVIIVGADGRPLAIGPSGAPEPDFIAMTRRANALRDTPVADAAEAVRLYRAAAEGGFAPAQNNLGAMYEKGIGVKQSDQQAAYWYRRAADQGEPLAQHSLGVMYLRERGVEHDPARGAGWLERSATQGHPGACADLANLYWSGEGVPRDKTRALTWWLVAAGSGHGVSARRAAAARHSMSKTEIAAAEKMARKIVSSPDFSPQRTQRAQRRRNEE